jgi:hypothetical protein
MNNSWKDRWQGFLKPLPVLKQIWWKIFIDFVVDYCQVRVVQTFW